MRARARSGAGGPRRPTGRPRVHRGRGSIPPGGRHGLRIRPRRSRPRLRRRASLRPDSRRPAYRGTRPRRTRLRRATLFRAPRARRRHLRTAAGGAVPPRDAVGGAVPRAPPPGRAGRRKMGRFRAASSLRDDSFEPVSPKTLTGAELQLDDAPARDSELFLVDGNNLAYRAFFALPEELATSEGFSTNALLGFTNMLFKLLSDYRPKGVAVSWDTRPVHRHEISETYKIERRPMPDLLREQFPYFRPIVEAFGYRNLEFEGWEADDVIATLAHD